MWEIQRSVNRNFCVVIAWSKPLATRLAAMVKAAGFSQERLAEATGIPRVTIQRILGGRYPPEEERLDAILAAIGATLGGLLAEEDGEGAFLRVGVFPIQVAAGAGRLPLDEADAIESWMLPRAWAAARFGTTADLKIVSVAGDSQEPELHDGDALMFDAAARELREGMHVVRVDDALLIKRIQIEGRFVRLLSRNPAYDPQLIDLAKDADRFEIIGKAVWAGKTL